MGGWKGEREEEGKKRGGGGGDGRERGSRTREMPIRSWRSLSIFDSLYPHNLLYLFWRSCFWRSFSPHVWSVIPNGQLYYIMKSNSNSTKALWTYDQFRDLWYLQRYRQHIRGNPLLHWVPSRFNYEVNQFIFS